MASSAQQNEYRPSAANTFAAKIAELRIAAGQRIHAASPFLTVAPALKAAPAPTVAPAPIAPRLKSIPVVARSQPELSELPNAITLKAVDLQRRLHLLVAHVNRTLPAGCHVLAWSILPKDIFEGELGRFLMIACDFYPCGPENTLLLPAMPDGVEYLKLPRHPLTTPATHIADASQRVRKLRQSVMADHDRALKALRNGDPTQMFQSSERWVSYRQELAKTGRDIAETAFGQNIWEEHESRFRKLLCSL